MSSTDLYGESTLISKVKRLALVSDVLIDGFIYHCLEVDDSVWTAQLETDQLRSLLYILTEIYPGNLFEYIGFNPD